MSQQREPTTVGQQLPPPIATREEEAQAPPTTAMIDLTSGFGALTGMLMVFPVVFVFLFHLGASFLSYQKYNSIPWAIVDFFFAVFYYPYYAFFLVKEPVQVPAVAPMMGGKRNGIFKFVKKWF